MTPVIGISVSTLMLPGTRGVRRFAIPDFYVRCVVDAGGLPLLFPNISADHAASYLSRIDGLVLSGGGDLDAFTFGEDPHPSITEVDLNRDTFELALARGAHDAGMPIFGICRGAQVLNVACGGGILQDIPSQVDNPIMHAQNTLDHDAFCHSIAVEPGTTLRRIASEDAPRVNSYHHQGVGRLAEGFCVSARASDGVIEALEDPRHPFCVGVQWHPERMPENDLTQALFRAHVEASAVAARAGA